VQTFPFCGSVDELDVDLLSASGHKMYGPQGAGVLYVRSGTDIQPLAVGGGQERVVRAGTENVAGIVGFAEALKWNLAHPEILEVKRVARDRFAEIVLGEGFVPSVLYPPLLNPRYSVLSGHFHCRYPGIEADTMLIRLDRAGVSASSGAACSSGSLEPSHVLAACGYSESECKEGLRFTFGKDSSVEVAEKAAGIVIKCPHAVLSTRV
jgi:cysteine desulfurase